jgi:hypothetical protein
MPPEFLKPSVPLRSKALPEYAKNMSPKVDRIELRRLFVRIAETRSLSAAGQALGLSQPSSSRQLEQLEEILGVQLVQRSTHDLVVTDAGEQFLPVAIELLNLWDGATETARLDRDEYRGPIRVAVPVAIGQSFLRTSRPTSCWNILKLPLTGASLTNPVSSLPEAMISGSGPVQFAIRR